MPVEHRVCFVRDPTAVTNISKDQPRPRRLGQGRLRHQKSLKDPATAWCTGRVLDILRPRVMQALLVAEKTQQINDAYESRHNS
jgi:hypothetical protein